MTPSSSVGQHADYPHKRPVPTSPFAETKDIKMPLKLFDFFFPFYPFGRIKDFSGRRGKAEINRWLSLAREHRNLLRSLKFDFPFNFCTGTGRKLKLHHCKAGFHTFPSMKAFAAGSRERGERRNGLGANCLTVAILA